MQESISSLTLACVVFVMAAFSGVSGLLVALLITKMVKRTWSIVPPCPDNVLVQTNHSRALDILNMAVYIGNGWKSIEVPSSAENKTGFSRRVGDK